MTAVSRSGDPAIWALLAAALLVRVAAALIWPNIHQPDEVFQTLEQAHRFWFGYGIVPWEWRAGIRSWLIPGLLAPVLGGVSALGFGPPVYNAVVAVLLSASSLTVVAAGWGFGRRAYGRTGAWLVGGLCAVWFEFVYFAPKTLTEVMAAHVLIAAVWFIVTAPRRLMLIGALLGVTGILRFHAAPMIVLASVWVCGADVRHRWPRLIAGAAVPLAFQTVLDWVTLGSPLQSVWLNFWINVVQARSEQFGAEPFYWYPIGLYQTWGPAMGLVLAAAVPGARHVPLLGWMVAVHVLAHSLVAHKEPRFLFPAMPMLIVLAGLGLCRVLADVRGFRTASASFLAGGLTAVALVSLFSATRPGFVGNWTSMEGGLAGGEWLRQQPDLRGLGVVNGPDWRAFWAITGGYYRLHRDVPIYPGRDAADLAARSPRFNYMFVPAPVGDRVTGFTRVRCWSGTTAAGGEGVPWCAYHRPGTCEPDPAATVNAVLPAVNE